MSTESIDFQFILEQDGSPLIVFDHQGKILWLNNVAEILLGYADRKELFDLALRYAPQSFGSRTTLKELRFRQMSFYALNVSYNSEEWVALRLYHRPRTPTKRQMEQDKLLPTDINVLLEAAITLFKMQHGQKLRLLTDQDLPPIRIDQNNFSKLLRKTLESFRRSSQIEVSLTMTIGEFILIGEDRYHLLRLTVSANGRYPDEDVSIRELAEKLQIVPFLEENSITFDIPFIQ
ncbi:MAG: hypothetical protein C6I05_06420 [Epsilonproteobacteria bacterium]|nr:hypothetical protein [Campylobacterota bacterium]